jgi:hypothetical protein
MAADLTVDAHLNFSVDIPGSATVTGVLTGSGKALELRVSEPLFFAGGSDAGQIRSLARGLAEHGLLLSVIGPLGPLVRLGVARTSWWQRRLTGSPHIRLERGAPLWSLARRRNRAPRRGVLPAGELAPPPTLFPIAPTMARRPRRNVTTTHDPQRGGSPRMIMAPRPHPGPGDRQQVFALRDDVTTIGSGVDCDIRLSRLEPLHAEIRHDADDEFVLVRVGRPGSTRVHGAPVDTARLRTGSRVDVGGWTMSFYREEFADHGRPYGGRIGGELGHQRPQAEIVGRRRPGRGRQ